MKNKNTQTLSYLIISIILACVSFYYYHEFKKRIYEGDIVTKEVTISTFRPNIYTYEDTDNIELEFVEYPKKTFKISYLGVDYDAGKEIISKLDIHKKVIIDIEKQHYRRKTKQSPFLGIKPTISLLGIRESELIEIPMLDYNVRMKSKNFTLSIMSLIGVIITGFMWAYGYVKNRIRKRRVTTS